MTERLGKVTLYVNPDPKSLWKNLESDRSDPMWKERMKRHKSCVVKSGALLPPASGPVARTRRRLAATTISTCSTIPIKGWYVAIVADGAVAPRPHIRFPRCGQDCWQFLEGCFGRRGPSRCCGDSAQAAPEGIARTHNTCSNALYVPSDMLPTGR